MGIVRTILLASGSLAFVTQPAAAQSLQEWDTTRGSELRGAISITIPLGGTRKTDNSAPRVDFAMQSYQPNADELALTRSIQPRRSLQLQSVMSLTLEQRPKLLLNGQRVASFGPRSLGAKQENDADGGGGGDTVLYIVGGVVLLGVVGTVAIVTDVKDAASDVIGPAD